LGVWLRLLAGASALALLGLAAAMLAAPGGARVELYVPEGCGCCLGYAEYLESRGFEVRVVVVEASELARLRGRLGVPGALASCHTGVAGGYAVEGHVPARALESLLAERPGGVRGLAVPGMPPQAPGMSKAPGPVAVYAFDGEGGVWLYGVFPP
jgi:hypothetical protein